MKNKRKASINMQLLAIVILSLAIVGFSMARFQNRENSSITAVAAKWLFEVSINNEKLTNEDNNFKINLQDTLTNTENTLETGYIAPGSYGNFEISIDCTKSETGIEYIYELVDESNSFPENIKFYTTENYSEASRILLNRKYKEYIALNEISEVKKIKVYWKWELADDLTTNEQDISNNGKELNIKLQMEGNQYIYEIKREATDSTYFKITEDGEISLNTEKLEEFDMNVQNLVIPSKIDEKNVTSIANGAFAGLENLQTVVVSSGVTTIGEYAFVSCKNLASVIMEDTVTQIGKNAFYGCNNLEYINLNAGLQRIENWAFDGCTSITRLEIPDSVTYIGESAFYNCTSVKQINIPKGISTINKWTFWNCSSIITIVIPNNITSIEEGAFGSCTSLYSVTFEGTVPTIGDSAFYKCDALTSNDIPENAKQ